MCGLSREGRSKLTPLSAAAARAFDEIPSDPAPATLIRRSHYWAGNERSLYLCHQAVARRRGAYLGVGSDQNYLLAGWARSEFATVVDFDQGVVDLHRCYHSLFRHAATAAEFVACWSDEARERTSGLLADEHERPDGARIGRAFRMAQPLVWERLLELRRLQKRYQMASFVDDAEQYDHIRQLVCSDRFVVVRGDFAGDATMPALAQALRGADLRLGVVYLSNVEQYLEYTPTFRRNMLALDVLDDAVVVRTLGWKVFGYAPGEQYHYNVQGAPAFAAWLRYSEVRRLPDLLRFRTKTVERGLSVLDRAPDPSLPRPEIAEPIEAPDDDDDRLHEAEPIVAE